MKKKALQKWLKDHPAISVRQIGIEAGYEDGQYFRKYIKKKTVSKDEEIPEVLWSRIQPVLEKYGLKTDAIPVNEG